MPSAEQMYLGREIRRWMCVRTPFSLDELADAFGLSMEQALDWAYDMKMRGHLTSDRPRTRGRTDEKIWRWIGPKPRPTAASRMWSVMRAARRFTTSELETMSGARRSTLVNYLYALAKAGYLKRTHIRGQECLWTLVRDTGPIAPSVEKRSRRVVDLNLTMKRHKGARRKTHATKLAS